jgi:hypothetical protein
MNDELHKPIPDIKACPKAEQKSHALKVMLEKNCP